MKTQTLTVLFWNTWFFVQDGRRDSGSQLLQRLGELIELYRPDVFGLNEVLLHAKDNRSPVMDFLTAHGYHCHFAPFSPTDSEWLVGNLLASKQSPEVVQDHMLGPDTQAGRRGFEDHSVKAIEAEFVIGGVWVTILVNYLCSLLPADWKTHVGHRQHYEQLLANVDNKNLVIGGDFNETKYMLPWLRLPSHLKRRTGTLWNPTWRLNGQKRYILYANYDNLVYSDKGNLRLQHFKVLDRRPSDHSPLLGVFRIV